MTPRFDMHPRYSPVARFSFFPETYALTALQREATSIQGETADLVQFKNILESHLSPNEILKHVKDYLHTHSIGEASLHT